MRKIFFTAVFLMGVTIGFSRNMLVFPSDMSRDLPPRPYAGLSDIIRTMDKSILKSSDENRIAAYLRVKNVEMANYVSTRYPDHHTGLPLDLNSPEATMYFMTFALFEENGFAPLPRDRDMVGKGAPTWLACAIGTLDIAFGISEIVSTLGTFSGGTVWQVVKWFVKKYVSGWLNVAIALVAVTSECL